MSPRTGFLTILTILVILAASASGGQASPLLEPVWRQQDTQLVLDRLGLAGDEAAETIAMLLADYEHQWLVARAELRDAVAQADPSEAVPMGALPLIVTFRNQQTSLSDRLAADMAFLLPDGSEERWLDLQNEIWRRRRLPRGHLAGENVDIWAILIPIEQDFGLHRSEQTEALLQEWEERVAELLTMREPYDLEGPTQFRNLVMEGDLEAGYQYLADWVGVRKALREHTKLTTESIIEILPDAAGERLSDDYVSAARLYQRPEHEVDKLVAVALVDELIDEEIRKELEALHNAWLISMDVHTHERRRIEWDLEPARMMSPMARRTDRADKTTELDTARLQNELKIRSMSEAHMKDICSLLGKETCERLRGTKPPSGPPILHPSGLPLDVTPPTPLPPGQPFPDKPDVPIDVPAFPPG
ncbi:MAG: Tim44 domain-containing protein [Phycisphaerales bacterium]|nr:Tim44 domain-containing protein [Phycisphaerales bacterium]